MKLKLIGFCSLVFVMSLVIIFGAGKKGESEYIEFDGHGLIISICEKCSPTDIEFGEAYWQPTPEPNDTIATKIYEGHTFWDNTERWWVYDGNEFILLKNLSEKPPEPNDPADNWVEAVERCPDAQGYITDNFGRTTPIHWGYGDVPWQPMLEPYEPLDFIPTWPDYIELDKRLWIGEANWGKGTKIYFKEEE